MPNTIELNLLSNKSIVATMQGIPLANENSYKIIAGEENATIFKVVSVPNQYKDKNFTIEMVNAKNYGINETQIKNISNYEFSLPVGMAVAGYSYILFRCKYTENGKQVVVPFQPLKVKVWNTIPQWQDYVDKTTNAKVVDGYLILTENGNEYNLGYVQGEKGDAGKDGKDHSVEIAEIKSDIADLYLLSNATVTGTEKIKEAYTARQTANGLSGLIDGALTKVLKVEGNTVACHNLLNLEAMKNLALLNNVEIDSDKNTIKVLNNTGGGAYIACISDKNGTAYEKFVKCFGISKAGKYRCTFKSLVNKPTSDWRFNIVANTIFRIGVGNGTVFEVEQADIDAIKSIATGGNVKLLVYGSTDDVFGEFQIVEGEEEKPYVPYFAGLKNASFKGITSTGRNLFDKSKAKDGYEIGIAQTGEEHVNAEWFVTNLIPVLPDTRYTITGKPNGSAVTQYDVNKKAIGSFASNGTTGFTTRSNTAFVKLNGKLTDKDTFQLEIGSKASEYTPYVEDTLELPVAVESGLGTTIDFENRKIINRGNEIVLDGTETIEYKDYNNGYYVLYWKGKLGGIKERRAEYVSTDAEKYSENNQWVSGLLWVGVDDDILYWVNAADYLGVYTGTDIEQMKADFAAYLKQRYASGNHVKIRYISNIPEELPLSTNKSKYKEWVGGSETVVQGTTDNSKYGAENTATNIYAIKKGVTE